MGSLHAQSVATRADHPAQQVSTLLRPAFTLASLPISPAGDLPSEDTHQAAEQGIHTPASSLPHATRIQQSFGRHSISGIQAHLGPHAARSARSIRASAYASGHHVVFAGMADVRTAAHEAAHVIQQRAGIRLAQGIGQAGDE